MYVCMYVCMRRLYLDVRENTPVLHACGLVYKSAGGLTRHPKIHKDVPQPEIPNNENFKCYICERTCKTKAGLKSHLRAHDRAVNNCRDGILLTRSSN